MLQRISTINQSVKGLLFVVKFSKVTAAAELITYFLVLFERLNMITSTIVLKTKVVVDATLVTQNDATLLPIGTHLRHFLIMDLGR